MAQIPAMYAKDLAGNITMRVNLRGIDAWRWRVKLGTWLIRLAAWVMWVNVEIDDGNPATNH